MTEIEQTDVFIRTGPQGQTPAYATPGSAGCDLFAGRAITLRPGESAVLPLDLVIALEPGVEAQIRPRSGLSLRTWLRVPNSPGTIDSDYRSDVGVVLQNTFDMAGLAGRILARPELALELAAHYRRVTLSSYLQAENQPECSRRAGQALEAQMPELARQPVYLDEHGNPYGTIYVQAGDRIAQMVFCRYLRADFHVHPEPESVGHDRGGGFGSTGVRQLEKS